MAQKRFDVDVGRVLHLARQALWVVTQSSSSSPPPLQHWIIGDTGIVGPESPPCNKRPSERLALFGREATHHRSGGRQVVEDERANPVGIRRCEEHRSGGTPEVQHARSVGTN